MSQNTVFLRRRHEIAQVVEKRVRRHVEEKLPNLFKPSLTGPSSNWDTFFRQKEAFEYARTKAKDLCVFAYESKTLEGGTGQRMYLAVSLPAFWHYYSQLNGSQRHHYEVIPEGAVCKLYFDLEFDKENNVGRDGDEMVETLIKYVSSWMKYRFGVTCTRNNVLDLDSSTNKKFSRHLIFQLTDVAFKDNTHAGNFVNYIFKLLLKAIFNHKRTGHVSQLDNSSLSNYMAEDKSHNIDQNPRDFESKVEIDMTKVQSFSPNEPDKENAEKTERKKSGTDLKREQDEQLLMNSFTQEELKSLVVRGRNDTDVLFCDTGVYTKNRNFRLYKSSKLGKNKQLELSHHNSYNPPVGQNSTRDNEIFFNSLVGNVRYTESLKVLTFESSDPSSSRIVTRSGTERPHEHLTHTEDTVEGYTKSPYPEIDDFIASIISSDGHHGYIRHWSYFTHDELLVYDLARFRFCENIGREHRSNNVMLIVDMKRGVFYQKCHDPECRGQNFKSADYKLPDNVLPAHYFEDSVDLSSAQDDFDSDLEDEDFVKEADDMEKSLLTEDEGMSDTELLSATEDLENSWHDDRK